jgi:hypothetical protein
LPSIPLKTVSGVAIVTIVIVTVVVVPVPG